MNTQRSCFAQMHVCAFGVVGLTCLLVGSAVVDTQEPGDWRWKPPVASFEVNPSQRGMMGLTKYRFDAGSSEGAEHYAWDFGDGISASGAADGTATHVYNRAGTFTATLNVSDVWTEGVAARRGIRVSPNLQGAFAAAAGADRIVLDVTQDGTSIGGQMSIVIGGLVADGIRGRLETSGSFNGSIASSNNFVCSCSVNLSSRQSGVFVASTGERYRLRAFSQRIAGTVNNGATTITGRLSGDILEGTLTVRRQ